MRKPIHARIRVYSAFRSRDSAVRRAAESTRAGVFAGSAFLVGLMLTNAHALRSLLSNDPDGLLLLSCLLLLIAPLFAILAFAANLCIGQSKNLGPRQPTLAWARIRSKQRR